MATLLGSPHKCGKSNMVESFKYVGAETGTATQLQEGLAVGLSGDSEHVAVGGTPKAITAAGHGKISVAGVVNGENVWAQADAGLTAPTIGGQVFITPAGKVSDTDNDGANTATNAVFSSTEVRTDGVSTNIKGQEVYNLRCACISFLGGL